MSETSDVIELGDVNAALTELQELGFWVRVDPCRLAGVVCLVVTSERGFPVPTLRWLAKLAARTDAARCETQDPRQVCLVYGARARVK